MLTGFLSAMFCVLGVIAGLCEWLQQFLPKRNLSSSRRIQELPMKNLAKRKPGKTQGKKEVAVGQDFDLHRKAA